MKLGLALLLVGVVMVGGFGAYMAIRMVVVSDDVNMFIRIGAPTMVVGALVLLVKAIWDRLREKSRPDAERIEEAQP